MRLGTAESLANKRPPPQVTARPKDVAGAVRHTTGIAEQFGGWRRKLEAWWSHLGDHLFSLQPERLIGISRLTFAAFALFAIFLDPTRPARNVREIYGVLAAYVFYASLLVVAPSREAYNARLYYIPHSVDIIVLSVLCILSGELSSPFWAFVGFALIASAIRWGFGGVLATAFLLIALFTAIGWPYYDPSRSDLNNLIMRSAYALVAAIMLGYFASYRDRSRSRLERLAAWPIEASADENDPWLEGSLRHASEVLGGLRLLVIWNDGEEPNGRIAYWDGDNFALRDFVAGAWSSPDNIKAGRFHDEPIADAVGLPHPISRQLGLEGVQIARGKPACCSAPFATQRYRGQVFVIDPGHPTDDMLSLTKIVAGRIAFELEQFVLMRELASAAGWRERGRLARDLHDSVLQDLTAAGLQLKVASMKSPETMQSSLRLIGKILQEQQCRIRSFVENAQPKAGDEPQLLKERLEAFSLGLSSQWNCALNIRVDPADMRVRDYMLAAICQIVSEATANAARHGQADRVEVWIGAALGGLDISISDNGAGMAEPNPAREIRPQSIQARVADLGGQFELDPSNSGLFMRILLPL